MQTFYGNIKFAAGGQNVDKPMVLFQVMCNAMEVSVKIKL